MDIDHLDSLDPELYRNLLSLKTYEGDVQVCVSIEQTQFFKLNILLSTRQDYVGIDFTIAVETFGETRIELLKPEGDSIPVTSENRFLFNVFIGSDSQSMPMIKSLGSSTSTLSLITS